MLVDGYMVATLEVVDVTAQHVPGVVPGFAWYKNGQLADTSCFMLWAFIRQIDNPMPDEHTSSTFGPAADKKSSI